MRDFFAVWFDLFALRFLRDANGRVSNSKVAVAFVCVVVGVIVWHLVDVPGAIAAVQWFLLAAFTVIISGAFGRTVWMKHLETKQATITATQNTSLTGDLAGIVRAAREPRAFDDDER